MKKVKEFSKKYLIGFTLGLITSGIVVVCAATYFPSNQTTYDNSVSGLNATNVQTAIDELYNTCFPPKTGGAEILEEVPIVTSGDGLYKDEYEDRYFYKGANPNNYITFNNETWRIISIENDDTIKVMRNESIGDIEWDSSITNNWAYPASLNTYLNGTYYNGLNATIQSQIVSKDWSIGSVTQRNNDLADQINDENSVKWNGKVALATASEYIRSNSNKSNCGTYYESNHNYNSCKSTTWMQNRTNWWILSPTNGIASVMFFDGSFGDSNAFYLSNAVRPAVYLSSKVKITDGTGTSTDPYQISL